MVDIRKLANIIMDILDKQPRKYPKLTNHKLWSITKDRTGDNTLQLKDVLDAVSLIELQHAVDTERWMGTVPPDFDTVKISKMGRANFQLNRDWPIKKDRQDDRLGQDIKIERVVGDIQISQSGDNIKIVSTTSFQELKDQIRAENLFSEDGKKEIIKNVEILEEESSSETPNKGRAQRAYNWIKEKSPQFVKDIVVNLIANLIAQGIIIA